jgi:regulator of protease activity HflC (stomatin/prohibitin superfamily)
VLCAAPYKGIGVSKFDSPSLWERYGPRTIAYVVGFGVFVLLALGAMGSCATTAKNTEVAIIVNNVTGGVSLLENGGMVLHLPYGLSSVYKIDKSQRVLYLTKDHHPKPGNKEKHSGGEQINIKTNDGSNVQIDVEVVYQLIAKQAAKAYRELGDEENIEDIIRALTRSVVRSEFGELTTLQISEAQERTTKLAATQKKLALELEPIGIEIVSINTKNYHFDEQYDTIVKDRKVADQTLENQKDYQDTATEKGKRMIAEAERDKQTALAQLAGDLAKKLLVAEGEAKRTMTKAQQLAYQNEREGEIALKNAEQEAAALLAEGQRKAEGIEKLMDAYEKGGEGLVREALAKLYQGVKVRARPYSVGDKIEQFRMAPVVPAGK